MKSVISTLRLRMNIYKFHFSFVSLHGRPAFHSEELQNFLESIWDKEALYGELNFDERISVLRKKVKAEKRNVA